MLALETELVESDLQMEKYNSQMASSSQAKSDGMSSFYQKKSKDQGKV